MKRKIERDEESEILVEKETSCGRTINNESYKVIINMRSLKYILDPYYLL